MPSDPTDDKIVLKEGEELREAEMTFGAAKNIRTGEIKHACRLVSEGKEYLGLGDTRKEAAMEAFRQIFPELKDIKIPPQFSWSKAAMDTFREGPPVWSPEEEKEENKWKITPTGPKKISS